MDYLGSSTHCKLPKSAIINFRITNLINNNQINGSIISFLIKPI